MVDFYCDEAKLGIELDGGQHAEPAQVIRDERRTDELQRLGVRILRFWNSDVLQNLEGVLVRILEAIRPPLS